MGNKKYFTLSFDDGVEHDKRLIELMKQYGLQGTFNLNAGLMGTRQKRVNISRIPKDEIRQVYNGFEIASHGYRHEIYTVLPKARVEQSITDDLQELSEIAGYPIAGHAYPFDAHTGAAENCLRSKGILYGRRATGKGSFCFPKNPYNYVPTCWFNAKNVLQLLDEFLQAEPVQGDMLFMMWGHAYEMEYGFRPCSESRLESIFSKIAGHEGIVYCTNKEAFRQQLTKTPGHGQRSIG